MAIVKEPLEFARGVTVEAEYSKSRQFAIHRPIGCPKDFVVTYIPDKTLIMRCRKKTDAKAIVKVMDFLWDQVTEATLSRVIVDLRKSVDGF